MTLKDNQKTENMSHMKFGWSKVNEMAKAFNKETKRKPKVVGVVKAPVNENEHKEDREDRE